MFSILVTEPGFEPRDHRNRSWASFLVTASKRSDFSNSVDRNRAFCDQQSLEGVGTYKQSHSLPLLEACFWASPRLQDQIHSPSVGPSSQLYGRGETILLINDLDPATLNHVGSKRVHPESNSDLFYSEHTLQASGSHGGQFSNLRTSSNTWRHFCLSLLGRCCWNQVSIDQGCCLMSYSAYSNPYCEELSGFKCQQW